MISHTMLGTRDVARAKAFYHAALDQLGIVALVDSRGAVGYGMPGDVRPTFWITTPHDGKPATVGNGTHVAFTAPSRGAVDRFHAAALAAGGTDEGAPGPRPHYHEHYYGAYVRDPDGNKIQACIHDPE